MTAPIFLEKIPGHAIPADDDSKMLFDSFKIGQKFEVLPWRDRNLGYHRKYFELINLVIHRNKNWKSAYFLIKLIQIDIGSVEVGRDYQDQIKQFPKSISFRSMSEIEFTKLFSDTVNHMLEHIDILFPGMPQEELKRYAQHILDFT